ncbi:GIN domain-containing protein [uncultured Muribaculum sp.]|uniref:GIN domain-containing protein n=1 Tax=uncultured Muribaculum sp. TaxID=1918613 RepID=UPI002729BFAE|nr:DUF2807 domain-containing protein [uncultured Muribaculum sp.]
MKKYLITLALAITATMTLSAANLQRITLKAKSFSSIVLNCAADIKLCQKPDSAGMIVYHIAPEIKDKIHFIVKNGTLECSTDRGVKLTKENISRITIFANSPVKSVAVNGSGDIKVCKKVTLSSNLSASVNGSGDIDLPSMNINELNLNVNGSGDINGANITVNSLQASVNGSGDLTISGTTSSANYALNGSGDISCSPLKAKIVNANCSGSGDITCHASVSITAKTELSGEITCHGNPSKKNLSGRTKNIHIK